MSQPVGSLIAVARRGKGWSQQELAKEAGYSPVMISKIESGKRVPSAEKIPDIARALGVDEATLTDAAQRPDERTSNGLKIVEAMKLGRKNADRANRLKMSADQLKTDADDAARRLDERVEKFATSVVDAFTQLTARVDGIPEEAILPEDGSTPRPKSDFSELLADAQIKTGRTIFTLMGGGLLGGGAGAIVGGGAATATYLTVASIATASTGAAISGLAGAAATSATLAAIGGGSLAAGGLGVAGGTAILTGIVALPVVGVAAVAVLASGGRVLEKQKTIQERLENAEKAFELNAEVVRTFIDRATSISEILAVALSASRSHLQTIDSGLPKAGRVSWSRLGAPAQVSIARMAEIILGCLTVLALPIGMSLTQAAPENALKVAIEGEESVPRLEPELDPGEGQTNEFMDYVIKEVFAQVAR